MSTFAKAARVAGVDKVICPQCGSHFSTDGVLRRFFQGVLKMVKSGDAVIVPKFGTFNAKIWKGRTHATPITPSGEVSFTDTLVLRFRQAHAARTYLNKTETKQTRAVAAANRVRSEVNTTKQAKSLRGKK